MKMKRLKNKLLSECFYLPGKAIKLLGVAYTNANKT